MGKSKPIFETQSCPRCGGCGRYSYCQMYGDTCFKCRGVGYVLTARGSAAQQYFTRLASKPANELIPGETIWVEDGVFGKSGWQTVTRIERGWDGSGSIDSVSNGVYQHIDSITVATTGLTHHTFINQVFRVRQDSDSRTAKLSLAISFERSLNKQGKTDARLAKLTKETAWG